MSNGNSDKAKSTVSKVKGEVKEQVGNLTDNKKMQGSGKKDKVKGSVQEASGDAKNEAAEKEQTEQDK